MILQFRFVLSSEGHRRVKDVTVVETNYTEYALVLKHKKINKEFTQVSLYGEPEINNSMNFSNKASWEGVFLFF